MDRGGDSKKPVPRQMNIYKDIGDKLLRLHRYKEAIKYYDKAVETATSSNDQAFGGLGTDKDNKDEDSMALIESLVSRSRAYSRLPNHNAAAADAALVDVKQPNRPSVRLVGAESRLLNDRFEDALVHYRQGETIRQKPDHLPRGVLIATEIIEDCIGRNTGDIFDYPHLGGTILKYWLTKEKLQDNRDLFCRKKKRKVGNEKMQAMRYLSGAAHSKEYLQHCLDEEQLYAGDVDAFLEIKQTIEDALQNLNRQQKTLLRYKPLYTYKIREVTRRRSSGYKARSERDRRKIQFDCGRIVFKLLKEAEEAQKKVDANLCLRLAHRAREFIYAQVHWKLPHKSLYLKHLYGIVGELFLSLKQLVGHWTDRENSVRILQMIGLKMFDNIEEVNVNSTFLPYIANPRKLLENCEQDLACSSLPIERAFLYHEMSRCNSQMNKYEQALTMAKRCLQEGRLAKDKAVQAWMVNGMFMVARFECILRNYVNSKEIMYEAYELVKTMGRLEVENFLTKTIDILELVEELPQFKPSTLQMREKLMMECMPSDALRKRMASVFFHMHHLHPTRRMKLVPDDPPPKARFRDSANEFSSNKERSRIRGRSKIFKRLPTTRFFKQ